MKTGELRQIHKLDILLSRIVTFFALINFFLLFLSINTNVLLIRYYTLLTMTVFLVYLLVHEFSQHFGWPRILRRLPDILMIIFLLVMHPPVKLYLFYILGRQTIAGIRDFSLAYEHRQKVSIFEQMSSNPPGYFMISFLLVISLGTMLLMLPAASATGAETPFIDALFTATSATCVTGLIVYDTGTYFSLFGQLVILSLIQIGALGIMTISASFFVIIGQKLRMHSESLLQNVIGEDNRFDMMNLIKHIVVVTISIEIVGAMLMYLNFRKDFGAGLGTIYTSVFHSISAFCNAGFSLYSDNLMRWYNDVWINLIFCGLIIIGGIGFPVIQDVLRMIRRKQKYIHLSLHTKIVLLTTLLLIVCGTVLYFLSEYNNTMQDYSLSERILASFFQSVTTRTAGFNTIDNSTLSDSSVLTSLFLMFVGASPGSTGGGVKTTAFFILLATVIAMFKGRRNVTAFSRRISQDLVKRAISLVTVSASLLVIMIFFLLSFEHSSFEKVIFEAFSAFATVGLSMGITADLTHSGRIIIILLMYLGRVGPLTLGFAISQRMKKTQFEYIEEKINIG
ncbi:MAG: TrkH family potassium uptake protein [Candidatus Cloacimonetes bacterium]|nr:TrkH family potassium uptake protein [Candidatus Cloacimonadota bacterium]